MIESFEKDGAPLWVIRPTRSLTWREAKHYVALISLLPLFSGGVFLVYGYPLVLPFSGLEVVGLWLAFYYVARAGQEQEVVSLGSELVVVEKGRARATARYEFPLAWVAVRLRGAPRRWYPRRLELGAQGRTVELGRFLTEGERALLAQTLINAISKKR